MAINENYVSMYQKLNKVKDIKYSGIHPFEKKKLIKKINTKIDNFDTYWIELIPTLITTEAEKYTNNTNNEDLMKLINSKSLGISEEDLKGTTINIGQTNIDKIFKKQSKLSREKFESFINKLTKATPKEKLYDKIENKVPTGGKCGSFDKFSKDIETELGITLNDNGKINTTAGIKEGSSMRNVICGQIEALVVEKLKDIRRKIKLKEKEEKKKQESF